GRCCRDLGVRLTGGVAGSLCSLVLVPLSACGRLLIVGCRSPGPAHLQLAERLRLLEGDLALAVELEQPKEARDHLERAVAAGGRTAGPALPAGRGLPRPPPQPRAAAGPP